VKMPAAADGNATKVLVALRAGKFRRAGLVLWANGSNIGSASVYGKRYELCNHEDSRITPVCEAEKVRRPRWAIELSSPTPSRTIDRGA